MAKGRYIFFSAKKCFIYFYNLSDLQEIIQQFIIEQILYLVLNQMKKSNLSTPTHNQKNISPAKNYVSYAPTTSHIFINQGRQNFINQNNPVLYASNFYKERLRKISTNSYQLQNHKNNQETRLISLDALQDRFSSSNNNSISNQTIIKQRNYTQLPQKNLINPIVFASKVTNLTSQTPIRSYQQYNNDNGRSSFHLQTIKLSQSARVLPTNKLQIKTGDQQAKQQCETPTLVSNNFEIRKLFSFNDDDFLLSPQQMVSNNKMVNQNQSEQKNINMKKSKKLKRMQSNDQNNTNRQQILNSSPSYLSTKGKHQFRSPKSLKRYMKDGHLKITKIYTEQSQKEEQSQNEHEGQQTLNNQLSSLQNRKTLQDCQNCQNRDQQCECQNYDIYQHKHLAQNCHQKSNKEQIKYEFSFQGYLQQIYGQLQNAKKKIENLESEVQKNQRLRKKERFQNQFRKKKEKLRQLEQEKQELETFNKQFQLKVNDKKLYQDVQPDKTISLNLNGKLQTKLMIAILFFLLLILLK